MIGRVWVWDLASLSRTLLGTVLGLLSSRYAPIDGAPSYEQRRPVSLSPLRPDNGCQ
jgi:hypothetical protein